MAEFKEVMKYKQRICDFYNGKCINCIFWESAERTCVGFMVNNPQEAEKLIMKWVSENPIKTNADKFKEVFRVEPSLTNCVGIKCPEKCKNADDCTGCNFKDFWNQEYVEPDKE